MLLCLAAIKSIPRDIESVEPLELSTWTQVSIKQTMKEEKKE